MKVTFLGTNGWYDTPIGNTCSVLVQTDDYDILFDAGNGIAKADRYISQERPTYLFISHYHIDHIAGLHTLVKFRFRHPLVICGSRASGYARSFVRGRSPSSTAPFPTFTELAEGEHALPFRVECRPLLHPVPCYGYSITLDSRKVAFCTDTGVCPNAVLLARDADLLIAECGLRPGEQSPDWPHLNPADAIGIARDARAKRLALIHFAPHLYPTQEDRFALKRLYEKDCPGLIVATDDLTIDV
jgi:ribonuclease BN (tRNA processing enzyme)